MPSWCHLIVIPCWDHAAHSGRSGRSGHSGLRNSSGSASWARKTDISRHLLMMKSFGHRIPAPTGLAESWWTFWFSYACNIDPSTETLYIRLFYIISPTLAKNIRKGWGILEAVDSEFLNSGCCQSIAGSFRITFRGVPRLGLVIEVYWSGWSFYFHSLQMLRYPEVIEHGCGKSQF